MVNSITEEIGKNTEEGECDGDSLEVRTRLVFHVSFWEFSSQGQNGTSVTPFQINSLNSMINKNRVLSYNFLCAPCMCFVSGLFELLALVILNNKADRAPISFRQRMSFKLAEYLSSC